MPIKRSRRAPLSRISVMHIVKLVFRSCLLLAATVLYTVNRVRGTGSLFGGVEDRPLILALIWLVFVIEMVLRFFPSGLESMGCQKQFARNFKETGNRQPRLQSGKVTFAVAASWIALNSVIGILYYTHVLDEGLLLLISLTFSVCDMICILFFCPFQTWFMKNKCCTSCRIYNWDYAMMFTPLLFINSFFARSILLCALLLLLRWEITVYRHPERFSEQTNACLSCANCTEKLCQHKTQLRHFLVTNRSRLQLKGNALMDTVAKAASRRRAK